MLNLSEIIKEKLNNIIEDEKIKYCTFENEEYGNNLYGNEFEYCEFYNCKITGCNFIENVLYNVTFQDVNASYASLSMSSIEFQ